MWRINHLILLASLLLGLAFAAVGQESSEVDGGSDPRLLYPDNAVADGEEPGVFLKALPSMEARAHSGDLDAAFEIAMTLVACQNMPRTAAEFARRLQELESQSNGQGRIETVKSGYQECRGIRDADMNLVGKWLEFAAERGHIASMLEYGIYGMPYADGVSQQRYERMMSRWQTKTVAYLKEVIEAQVEGSSNALYQLGRTYLNDGFPQQSDAWEAISYFKAYERCTGNPVDRYIGRIETKYGVDADANANLVERNVREFEGKACPDN